MDACGVDVAVGSVDLRVLGPDLIECPLPQVAGVGQHVGLVDQREVVTGPGGSQPVGMADAALDAHAGVDRALGGDLVGRAPAQGAPLAGVDPLGVLAHHHRVEARRGEERAQVDVEVQREAQGQ